MVSPLSDPKKSPFWTVISNGCSSDPSLTLGVQTKGEEEEEADGNGELEVEKDEREDRDYKDVDDNDESVSLRRKMRIGSKASGRMEKSSTNMEAEEENLSLRFSFLLRPVYNDSMQFLHCSLRLCVSDSTRGGPMKEESENDCEGGLRIPPLVSRSPRHQVNFITQDNCS